MKKALFTFLIVFSWLLVYCQKPHLQNLGKVAVITFLDTPQIKKTEGGAAYVYKSDNTLYYALFATGEKSFVELLRNDGPKAIYNGYVEGLVSSLKGKVIYNNQIILNRLKGIEFKTLSRLNDKAYYGIHRVFYFNNTMVNYSVWSHDTVKLNAAKEVFFKTFKITANKTRQSNGPEEYAHLTGKVIGTMIAIGMMLSVIALIVFIIVKLTRKKKTHNWQ